MTRNTLWFSLIAASAMLIGCDKKSSPANQTPAPPPSPSGTANPSSDRGQEDPEVVNYLKKKGWSIQNMSFLDGERFNYLSIEDPKKFLGETQVTMDDLKMIARSKTVQLINFYEVKLTDEELKVVALIPQLEAINLNVTKMTDAALKEIAKNSKIHQLKIRTDSDCQITDAGIENLSAMKGLKKLHITGCDKVTATGIKKP